jgi:hypothetical protein
MSKLGRVLILGATLAAMNLAGLTAIAQANDQPAEADAVEQFRRGERASQEQPTTGKAVEEFRRGERASQEQTAADAALQRQLARERHSIPSATPAQVPAPVPDEPSGTSGWLLSLPSASWLLLLRSPAGWPCWPPSGAAELGSGTQPDQRHGHAARWGCRAHRQPHRLAGDRLLAYLAVATTLVRALIRAGLQEHITSPSTVGNDLQKRRVA